MELIARGAETSSLLCLYNRGDIFAPQEYKNIVNGFEKGIKTLA